MRLCVCVTNWFCRQIPKFGYRKYSQNWRKPQEGSRPQGEDYLKSEDDLNNEDDFINDENIKDYKMYKNKRKEQVIASNSNVSDNKHKICA